MDMDAGETARLNPWAVPSAAESLNCGGCKDDNDKVCIVRKQGAQRGYRQARGDCHGRQSRRHCDELRSLGCDGMYIVRVLMLQRWRQRQREGQLQRKRDARLRGVRMCGGSTDDGWMSGEVYLVA